jgi:hypothetical protein
MTDHEAARDASTTVAALPELLAATIETLKKTGAPIEALGELRRGRGVGRLRTAPALHPVGHAWRLGVLLLTADGELFATGEITRAIQPQVAVTNRSETAERKREFRRAAVRGRFPEGETINHGFTPIALDADSLAAGSGPLSVDNGTVVVRWSAGLGTRPLAQYLDDRARLLTEDWA